jgi:superfamily I DNA/RNA helicase
LIFYPGGHKGGNRQVSSVYRVEGLERIEPENALIFYPGGHKGGNIQVSSVYRFKGLERKVVILAEIDQSIGQQIDSVLYVGCSRARTHLILLMDENVPIEVKNKVDPVIKEG